MTATDASPTTDHRGGYTLDNSWSDARQRLGYLEQCFDGGTTRRLAGLGVGAGWRCLEVGAGGGSITRWLADRVGPTGRVVAVDLDTRFVADVGTGNVEVHERDIAADGLPGVGYDLIHARAVLMHIPGRDDVLAAMLAALRPGGWLLIEEGDIFPAMVAAGAFADGVAEIIAALTRTGVAWTWARDLPARLDAAGLDEVDAQTDMELFRGRSPWARLLQVSSAQLRPLLLAGGTTPDVMDRFDAVLDDPRQWFPSFALICARGRRPMIG